MNLEEISEDEQIDNEDNQDDEYESNLAELKDLIERT